MVGGLHPFHAHGRCFGLGRFVEVQPVFVSLNNESGSIILPPLDYTTAGKHEQMLQISLAGTGAVSNLAYSEPIASRDSQYLLPQSTWHHCVTRLVPALAILFYILNLVAFLNWKLDRFWHHQANHLPTFNYTICVGSSYTKPEPGQTSVPFLLLYESVPGRTFILFGCRSYLSMCMPDSSGT